MFHPEGYIAQEELESRGMLKQLHLQLFSPITYLFVYIVVYMKVKVTQLCPTFCDPMD